MTVLFVRVEAGGEDCNGNQVSNREKDKRKMKQNMQDLTEGPLGKKILIFSVPLMLSNLLQVLFNMADIADRKSTRLNSSHNRESRMPSSA